MHIPEDGRPVGLLRFQMFWDNTPFCTMLVTSRPFGAGAAEDF